MPRILRVILILLVSPELDRSQDAQRASPQNTAPVFKVGTELVVLPVAVLGKNNKPLTRLQLNNFRVFEKRGNGKFTEQKIDHMNPAEKLPLRAGILIDTSESVTGKFLYEKDVAAEVIKLIINPSIKEARGDKVFVAEFAYEALSANPGTGMYLLKRDWTNKPKLLIEEVIKMKVGGLTPLFGGIDWASKKFAQDVSGNFASILIVISDGGNNMPFSSLKNAAASAQSAQLPIYTIGTTDSVIAPEIQYTFRKNLREVAKSTGGRFFALPRIDDLPGIATQILTDLNNRYYIDYKLSSAYENGDQINIKIEVGDYDRNGKWKPIPSKLLYRENYRVVK